MRCKLTGDGNPHPGKLAQKVREGFAANHDWTSSEAELRKVRRQVTFALCAEEDDLDKVTGTVEALFRLLQKSFRP